LWKAKSTPVAYRASFVMLSQGPNAQSIVY